MAKLHKSFLFTFNYIIFLWIANLRVQCSTQLDEGKNPVEENIFQGDSNNLIGCLDSDGIRHGLFSTWMENPLCWCTCQPVSRMAVSICDGCEIIKQSHSSELNISYSSSSSSNNRNSDKILQNDTLIKILNSFDNVKSNSGEFNQKRSADNYHDDKTSTADSNTCYYAVTKTYYQHKDIWMSAEQPCVKCKCQHGKVHCVGEPHQCPSICLPGQYSLLTGPCCHTVCKGSVPKNATFEFASCLKSGVETLHSHGEMITLSGVCVDQKCQCVNGRWNCFDYCTPLSELSCPTEEMVVWDPFCCPRCQGDQICTVNVDKKNWLSDPNDGSNVNSFRRLEQESLEWSELSDNQREEEAVDSQTSITNSTVNTEAITIQPGRLIWHEDDCFYMNGQEISYHPVGTRWIPNGDHCTECICEANQTYRCKRQTCQQLFLCPSEQIPMTSEDECCPSYCGLPSEKDQAKSYNYIQDKQMNDESNMGKTLSNIDALKSENKIVTILTKNESNLEKLSLSFNNGCSSLIDNENIVQYPNVFPSGSRLLLIRSCRSLLCICAKDNRWVCTDHCPPCEQTLESIENLRQISPPPKDKCCELCNGYNSVQSGERTNINSLARRQEIIPKVNNQTNLHYPSDQQIDRNYVYAEIKQVKVTLKKYILIFSLVLVCIFGLPIIILIGCYFMRIKYNGRRKNGFHYTSPKVTRLGYRYYYRHCYSHEKPFITNLRNPHNKDQSGLEASVQSSFHSSSSSSSSSTSSYSSLPVLMLKESDTPSERGIYNLTAATSPPLAMNKATEHEHTSNSIHQHRKHHHPRLPHAISNFKKLISPSSSNIYKVGEHINTTSSSSSSRMKNSCNLIEKFSDQILSPTTTTVTKHTNSSPMIITLKPTKETNTSQRHEKQITLTESSSVEADFTANKNQTKDVDAQCEIKPLKYRIPVLTVPENSKSALSDHQKSPKEILLKNLVLAIDDNNTNNKSPTHYNNNTNNDSSSKSHIKSEPSTPNIFMRNVTFNSYYSTCSSPCCSRSPTTANDHTSHSKNTIPTDSSKNNLSCQQTSNVLRTEQQTVGQKSKREKSENDNPEESQAQTNKLSLQVVVNSIVSKATRDVTEQQAENINPNIQHKDRTSLNEEMSYTNDNNSPPKRLTNTLNQIEAHCAHLQPNANDNSEHFNTIPKKHNSWLGSSNRPITWPNTQHFTSHINHPIIPR
ncbi:unnamed protein product [Heterobilharzia americana]|nr:unnamed protein product [Heterobilharzia americana]